MSNVVLNWFPDPYFKQKSTQTKIIWTEEDTSDLTRRDMMISVLNTNRVQIQQHQQQLVQHHTQQHQHQPQPQHQQQTIQMRVSGVGSGSGSGSGSVSFGSLNVDENSSTPYTDATQVRSKEESQTSFIVKCHFTDTSFSEKKLLFFFSSEHAVI